MVTARVRAGAEPTSWRVGKRANRPVGRAFGDANSIADLMAMRRKMGFIRVGQLFIDTNKNGKETMAKAQRRKHNRKG
jgi:hypothetical protein